MKVGEGHVFGERFIKPSHSCAKLNVHASDFCERFRSSDTALRCLASCSMRSYISIRSCLILPAYWAHFYWKSKHRI